MGGRVYSQRGSRTGASWSEGWGGEAGRGDACPEPGGVRRCVRTGEGGVVRVCC